MGGNWDSGFRSSTSGGGTGGRFDSDDEDKNSEQSANGVSEFKDDEDFGGKKSPRNIALPRKPSGGKLSDFSSSRSVSTSSASGLKKSSKPSRKVDLGAAADFANKAKVEQKSTRLTENNNQIVDFFSESSNNPVTSQPTAGYAPLDDDFDPRAGETSTTHSVKDAAADLFGGANNNSNNDGGDFADFSSAFTGSTTSATNAEDDLFGGFAGGAATMAPVTAPSSAADLFGGLSEGPASLPVPSPTPVQPSSGGLDLFSGLSSQQMPVAAVPVAALPSSAAASSMDLLGGLDFAGN
jgi:hypothetical protein